MQPHEKSVKLFVDCLFICSGSGKPFLSNRQRTVHARRRELSQLVLERNLPDFEQIRTRAKSSIIFYSTFIFYPHIFCFFNSA